MSDWQPQIVKIEKVERHPYADSLDIVTVLGDYPVITKRFEYNVGDLSAYIPIDSIVPDNDIFYFLCPKNLEKYEENGEIKTRTLGPKYQIGSVPEKYRIIKAKKIRNIYSQGMLVSGFVKPDMNPGDSIEEILGLKKWEEQEEENCSKIKSGNADKPPSGWSIPYYDIEGLRKYISCLSENEEIVLSEKIHGSNFSACYDGEKLWVKSRNFYKRKDPDDSWWSAAIRLNLEEKLSKFPNMVFFGELYGLVKNFRYDCSLESGKINSKVAFFDIWNVKTMRYLDYDDFTSIIKELDLNTAPELYRGVWKGKDEMYPYAEGMTMLGGKHIREGFVLRTVKERFEPKLNSRMQVKLVGEGYNLQK